MTLHFETVFSQARLAFLSYAALVVACELLFSLLHSQILGVTWFVPSFRRRLAAWTALFWGLAVVWKGFHAVGQSFDAGQYVQYAVDAILLLAAWPEAIAADDRGLRVSKLIFWKRRVLRWQEIAGVSVSYPQGNKKTVRALVWTSSQAPVEYDSDQARAERFLAVIQRYAPTVKVQTGMRESFVRA